ncbi:MAG TPA: hypothetical protein VHC90_05625 [Bryobacteraceae bacterium]|nr:hypothetical protein [Bryobacteraceae bacterium]
MRGTWICILPVFSILALAPLANADSIYVYDLSAGAGISGYIGGTITIEGNNGDAVPLLDSADVLSFDFYYQGTVNAATRTTWDSASSTLQYLSDSMNFNGTLGDTTLQGTSGLWEVLDPPKANAAFYLFGQPRDTNFGEYWGFCVPNTLACADTGDYHVHWTLTLDSVTDNPLPEPGTVWLGLGAAAVFCVRRLIRAV